MTSDTIHLLRKSFARVEAQQPIAALVFYQRLFERDPALRPLFRTDIETQSRKLVEMLSVTLALLEEPEQLRDTLEELAARHVGYGVREEHYDTVGQALAEMLAAVLGDEFTLETREAWAEFYVFMADTMKRGAAAAQTAVRAADRPLANAAR